MKKNSSAWDYPEDINHENGRYISRCCHCGVQFFGQKRRVACKECSTRATADATPIIENLIEQAREYRKAHPMTPAEHRKQCISFAYGNVHLANPNVTREMVETAYDELHPDEADRAEKEPLAERPQGVDVEKLRTDLALYHGLGARNITALLDELEEAREQIAVFLPTVKVAQRRQDAAEARVAELERILSAERAEYDWAVKGAKALEAKLARAQNVVRVSSMDAGTKTHLLTILNGGTN